jgi:hypothetical protein
MKKGTQPAHRWCTGHWTVPCPVGHPDSLRRGAHNGRSRSTAPDSLGNGRIQQSIAIDRNG